jgi:hypothetical protein
VTGLFCLAVLCRSTLARCRLTPLLCVCRVDLLLLLLLLLLLFLQRRCPRARTWCTYPVGATCCLASTPGDPYAWAAAVEAEQVDLSCGLCCVMTRRRPGHGGDDKGLQCHTCISVLEHLVLLAGVAGVALSHNPLPPFPTPQRSCLSVHVPTCMPQRSCPNVHGCLS